LMPSRRAASALDSRPSSPGATPTSHIDSIDIDWINID
jgi:hypothetical protein